MKAVVLEIRGAHAAVLQEDGVIVKVEKGSLRVGDTVNVAETVEKETTPSKGFGFGKLIIAAVAIFVAVIVGVNIKNTKFASSYVSLDINPSIEYGINTNNRIVTIKALNSDAEKIVNSLNDKGVKKVTFYDAMKMTEELLRQNQFITGDTNYILVDVASNNKNRAGFLENAAQEAFKSVNTTLPMGQGSSLVIRRSSIADWKKAKSYDISSGYYAEIKEIVRAKGNASSKVGKNDIAQYKGMSVQELIQAEKNPSQAVETTAPESTSANTSAAQTSSDIESNNTNTTTATQRSNQNNVQSNIATAPARNNSSSRQQTTTAAQSRAQQPSESSSTKQSSARQTSTAQPESSSKASSSTKASSKAAQSHEAIQGTTAAPTHAQTHEQTTHAQTHEQTVRETTAPPETREREQTRARKTEPAQVAPGSGDDDDNGKTKTNLESDDAENGPGANN